MFGPTVARGLADTLGLQKFCGKEMEQAFEQIDLDGNSLLDEDEVRTLLESVYVFVDGQKIEQQRTKFFTDFQKKCLMTDLKDLTREQFTE